MARSVRRLVETPDALASGQPPSALSFSRLTLTANRRFRTFWVGAFARYDNLSGAVFEDSPLVKRKDSFMAGVGIAWILAQASHP